MNQLKYVTLFTGPDDKTHFKDNYIPWQPISASAKESVYVTPFKKATDIGFLRLPPGLKSGWHPAPKKQFVMVLTGIMEVEAGDGQKITFAPGSVLLVTDVTGKGHRTNVISGQEVLVAWVPIPS